MVWPTLFDNKLDEYDAMDLPGLQLDSSQAQTSLDHILNLDITSPPACQRLTGIIASIGKTTSIEVIEKMIAAGLNIAMINYCFGTKEENLETIKNIRQASKNYSIHIGRHCPLAIMAMLPGRKIRTGTIAESYGETVEIKTEDVIKLTTDETYKERCSAYTVYVDFMQFAEQVKKGDYIYLDNETIMLKVEIISATTVTCKVERGGILGSYKDVFVPYKVFDMPNYTDRDKDLIDMSIKHQLDILLAPFASTTNAITELRHLLGEKGKRIVIVANIQTIDGYQNFDDILEITNGVMITRQELGSDITPKKLVIAQKNMIARANKANIPVFVNAQLLSSMRYAKVPLRSEILDIANCVLDGADALVLSAETAVGLYPIETLECMATACKEAEACIWTKQVFFNAMNKTPLPCDHVTGTAVAAILAAHRVLAAVIVAVTSSGNTAHILSKYKPRCPIIAITRYAAIARQMQMWRAVIPLVFEDIPNPDWEIDLKDRIKSCTKWAMERGFLRVGDPYIVVSGWKQGSGYTNTLRIMYATGDAE